MKRLLIREWPVVLGVALLLVAGWDKRRETRAVRSVRITAELGQFKFIDFVTTNRYGVQVVWETNLSATGFSYTAKRVPWRLW